MNRIDVYSGVSTMLIRRVVSAATVAVVALGVAASPPPAGSTPGPVDLSAPYEYLGWGNPPPPTEVMAATGIRSFTLAFILSHGRCDPTWDGFRPLTGGSDQAAIGEIRAAGGDVVVSFGGWDGKKLGISCRTASALAAAYQKVIDAYALQAIDIDIEHTEIRSAAVRRRVVDALALVQIANPGLAISITFPTSLTGPDKFGRSLIAAAAATNFRPAAWTIMPFDFGTAVADMGEASIVAAEGLAQDLENAYGESAEDAYRRIGISSINGSTGDPREVVSLANFETMLAFAQQNHLARFTFWSVNRDRPCAHPTTKDLDDCSGIDQVPYAFTNTLARLHP